MTGTPAVVSREIVRVRVAGDVLVATLDDGKVNAIGRDLVAQLRAAVADAVARRCPLVVAGRPGALSAGFDLRTVDGPDTGALERLVDETKQLYLDLLSAPVPVVVAVTGHAVAAGALLALCGDHRIGQRGPYVVGLSEVRLGLALPDFALTLAAARLDPRHHTAAILFGEAGDPERALELGFLDELADDAVAAAERVAAELAQLPVEALAVTRRLRYVPLVATLRTQSLQVPRVDPW